MSHVLCTQFIVQRHPFWLFVPPIPTGDIDVTALAADIADDGIRNPLI